VEKRDRYFRVATYARIDWYSIVIGLIP
jgi:hypothetical protein